MKTIAMAAILACLCSRGVAETQVSVGLLRASKPSAVTISCRTGLFISNARNEPSRIATPICVTSNGDVVKVSIGRMRARQYPALTIESYGSSPTTITASGISHSYRGKLRISSRAGSLIIVNVMPLEDYTRGIVANEMCADWPMEALKAQSVVARTLAVARIRQHHSEGFDICDTTHCQVYRGVTWETSATDSAVRSTARQILTSGDATMEPLYCSTCGGATASTFGSRVLNSSTHAICKKDILNGSSACKSSPHFTWTSRVSTDSLAAALRSYRRTNPGYKLDDLRVVRRDPSGRAKYIEIKGSINKEVDGYLLWNVVCRKLGWATIKSTKFDVVKSGDSFIFRGHGLGHGVGMCQWGAHKRAESGWNYRAILRFYYPGCRCGHAELDSVSMHRP